MGAEKEYTMEELRKLPEGKRKHETLKMLKKAAKYKKMYDDLREDVDGWTHKQTTTFTYHGNTDTVVYEDTTDTRTDYKGLFAEFGVTKEDKERYTKRTPITRFKAVL